MGTTRKANRMGYVKLRWRREEAYISVRLRTMAKVKQARAHLLVMYVKTPPKFLTCWKLSVCLSVPPDASSMIPASTPVTAAMPCAEANPENAAEDMFCVLPPVASAITLPLFRNPSKLSMRSGTVMKAREPARAIMRGTARRRSLGEGLRKEVAFEAEALTCPKVDVSKEVEDVELELSVVIFGGSCPEAAVFVEDILGHNASGYDKGGKARRFIVLCKTKPATSLELSLDLISPSTKR